MRCKDWGKVGMRTCSHHDHATGDNAIFAALSGREVTSYFVDARCLIYFGAWPAGPLAARGRLARNCRRQRTVRSAGPSETPCRRCRCRSGSLGEPVVPLVGSGPATRRSRPHRRRRHLPAAPAVPASPPIKFDRRHRSVVISGFPRYHSHLIDCTLRKNSGSKPARTCRSGSPKAASAVRSSAAVFLRRTARQIRSKNRSIRLQSSARAVAPGGPPSRFTLDVLDCPADRHPLADDAGSGLVRQQACGKARRPVKRKFGRGLLPDRSGIRESMSSAAGHAGDAVRNAAINPMMQSRVIAMMPPEPSAAGNIQTSRNNGQRHLGGFPCPKQFGSIPMAFGPRLWSRGIARVSVSS